MFVQNNYKTIILTLEEQSKGIGRRSRRGTIRYDGRAKQRWSWIEAKAKNDQNEDLRN